MRTTYGTSIPPGLTSSPTRGQLKVRIDRVVLDQSTLEPIIGNNDGAARRVCETPYVTFHFWGGEDQPSPVINPSSLTTRTGPVAVVFPIKTSRNQCEAYFKHMTVAKSGLEIRVLMHDIKTSREAKMVQQQNHHEGSSSNVKTYHVTQAETASATLGRALVRLDELSVNSPTSGWFSIVTLPEDSNGFSNIASNTVLGRMKLSLSLEYFADGDKNKKATTTSTTGRKQSPNSNNNNNNNEPRSRSSSAGKRNQQGRLENKLYSRNNIENNENNENELVVVGKAIEIRHEEEAEENINSSEHNNNTNANPRKSSRSSSANNNVSSSSNKKPPLPKVVQNRNQQQQEEADALLAAGLKLRQQLADATNNGSNPDDIETRTRLQNQMNRNNDHSDPYSRLTLNQAPHQDEEDPYSTSKKNRNAAKKFDKYAGQGADCDDDDDEDSDDSDNYDDAYLNNYLDHKQDDRTHEMLLRAGYPTERIARIMMGREQQQQQQQRPQQPHNQQPQYQQQNQQQNQYRPASSTTTTTNILPNRNNNTMNQYYGSSTNIVGGGSNHGDASSKNTLVGQFVVRVCVGQLALQSPCSAVKLVARFSPDIFFTVPPELGCFVSPDVELPIADDDVVGFNVSGIRRLTSNSRVVVELYAKPIVNNNSNQRRTSSNDDGDDDDDFSLVGLSMAPICSTAGSGVIKNVSLRNPLSGGSVSAQCDLYVNFFQEIDQEAETAKINTIVINNANQHQHQNQQQQGSHVSSRQPSQQQQQDEPNPQNQNQQQSTMTSTRASSQQNQQLTTTTTNENQNNHQMTINPTSTTTVSTRPTSEFTGHVAIEVVEAKNLKPVQDGDLVTAPSTFVVIDDVMVQLTSSLKQQSSTPISNQNNNDNNHINSSTSAATTTFDLVNGIEVSANDWETRGPDASRVVCDTSKPQYNFKTEIFLGSDLLPTNNNNNNMNSSSSSSTKKKLSHIHISIHHCRNKTTCQKFISSYNSEKTNDALFLDPERDPSILELLQNSVELGVAAVPMSNCMSPKLMFPFDGWVHVMDEVTGSSVGQVRIRCYLK